MKLLNERDGLALGICNGFQALIKLGLVPYGAITGQKADSPTLTFNTIGPSYFEDGLHEGRKQQVPVAGTARRLGGVYVNPASHGEGRFVADHAVAGQALFANGQVATQYCDPEGMVCAAG